MNKKLEKAMEEKEIWFGETKVHKSAIFLKTKLCLAFVHHKPIVPGFI